FQHGAFTAGDTAMTRLSLVAQATAIPAFLLVKVLAPAFYSRQDTRTPVKAALAAVAGNVVFTVLLMLAFLHFTGAGRAALAASGGDLLAALGRAPGAHAALALSIGLAGWLNAGQLWWYLRRAAVYSLQPGRARGGRAVYALQAGWARVLRQLLLAAAAMVVVVAAILSVWDAWTTWPWWERVWRLLAVVAAGGASYVAALWMQGIRPSDL